VRVVACVPDLMDRSKLAAALTGLDVTFVPTPAALGPVLADRQADLVLLDLSRPGAIDAIAGLAPTRVVAFGSHVERELLDRARTAGAEVMARSAFFGPTGFLAERDF
jgi:hypothetical protein